MQRFRVAVQASDPISHTGITRYLTTRPQVRLVAPTEADVVVLAPARLDPQSLAPRRRAARPAILVTNRIGESDLVNLVECRISAVLPRVAATDDRLLDAITSVTARNGSTPDDLLAHLVARAEHLRHEVLEARGLRIGDLAPREVDVLRLMADGLDTAEIAEKLCYSQRTVKNIIHGVNSRLGLRNRQHAVAFAMRTGVI